MVDRKKKPPSKIWLVIHKEAGICPRDCEYIPRYAGWDTAQSMECDVEYVRSDLLANKLKAKDKIIAKLKAKIKTIARKESKDE